MAVTATTTLANTDWTPKATKIDGVYLADWYTDPLKIKRDPSGDLIEYHNHKGSGMSNQTFTVYDIFNYSYGGTTKWCREIFDGGAACCGYQQSDGQKWVVMSGTPACTFGQMRLVNVTVTASRDSSSSKTLKVKYDFKAEAQQGPIESYNIWRVLAVFGDGNGGTTLIQDRTWSNTWSKTTSFTDTFEETSGKSTISTTYGIYGDTAGSILSDSKSYKSTKTSNINIPPYIPSPIRQYNGSSWEVVYVRNATSNDNLQVKQYNGSSWVDL